MAVCEGGLEPGSVVEGGRGEGAAAGWLVVVRVVEVDTDWPLTGPSPDPGPGPLGCAVGEGDTEVILKRRQSVTLLVSPPRVLTLLQPPRPMSWLPLVTWLRKTAVWLS